MEPGKRKKIKTEEAMGKDVIVEVYLERIKDLGEEIRGFKLQSWIDKETIKEISLKNSEANQTVEELSRKLSACEHAKKMSDWIQEDMKRRELENLRCVEDLRRKNLEASRCVEELRRQMLAYEEEKKTASRVQDVRELENLQCVEDLRQQNLKSNRKVEELRSRILAFEEDKKTSNLVLEEMKTREMENFRCLEDLRRKNSEADRKVEELGDRVSSLEEENRTAVRVREEMKLREMDSERRLEGLERQKLEADRRMNEMKVRESDLRQQLLKADDRVKEMEGRSLEDLRRKKLEAYRCVEELQRLILAYEEGKKMASRVQEVRELENLQCVEDLKRQNLESNRKVEELRSRVLAFEEDKKTSNLVLEEMKTREIEHFRCLEDLRWKNSEADRKVEEMGDRISALEEENRTAVQVREEMKVRETNSKRRLDGLERQKLEADKRMNEMKARETDLRQQILEADDRVKEMEGRSLEACKAAEENIKRFENVLPIAEDSEFETHIINETKKLKNLSDVGMIKTDEGINFDDKKTLLQINDDLCELENLILEKNPVVGAYQVRDEMEFAKMTTEIEELKLRKQADDQIIENLRLRILVLEEENKTIDRNVKEMKQREMEAAKLIVSGLLKAGEAVKELRKELNVKDLKNMLVGETGIVSRASSNHEIVEIIPDLDDGNGKGKQASSSPVCAKDHQTKKRKEITTDCCHLHRRLSQ